MSKIANSFKNTKAYVAYITAGDGGLERSLTAMQTLSDKGVDILEVGVPFSDSIADGPVIQAASQRALEAGTTLKDVLKLVKDFRVHNQVTPIILFSYYNPILQAGFSDFFKQAKAVGVDGCLIVDLPIEESDEYCMACDENNLDPILLISQTTCCDRIKAIGQRSRGMLYYACRRGTTGVKNDLPADFSEKIKEIKNASHLPVVVGFGISHQAMAKNVLKEADGFVVGSLLVEAIGRGVKDAELGELVQSLDPR